MNRLEFIESFNIELFINYFNTVNNKNYIINDENITDMLQIIFENYPEIDNNTVFYNYDSYIKPIQYIKLDEANFLHKNNILCLSFNNFFANVFYIKYIDNTIDYNENIFLLYSIIYHYKDDIRVISSEISTVYKIFLNSFFGFIYNHSYIENFYPNIIINEIFNGLEKYIIYINTDFIFLKNMNYEKIEDLISPNILSELSYDIKPIKYLFIYDIISYISYYKKDSSYKFEIRSVDKPIFLKIEKEIIADLRKEKIKKMLYI